MRAEPHHAPTPTLHPPVWGDTLPPDCADALLWSDGPIHPARLLPPRRKASLRHVRRSDRNADGRSEQQRLQVHARFCPLRKVPLQPAFARRCPPPGLHHHSHRLAASLRPACALRGRASRVPAPYIVRPLTTKARPALPPQLSLRHVRSLQLQRRSRSVPPSHHMPDQPVPMTRRALCTAPFRCDQSSMHAA
jgi:hypothetical protein